MSAPRQALCTFVKYCTIYSIVQYIYLDTVLYYMCTVL